MVQYLKRHENYINVALESSERQDWEYIKKYHLDQIGFLQHERLIHLLVTIAFGFILFGILGFVIATEELPFFGLLVLVGILECFYLVHMYRLENGVQRWYELYNRICLREREVANK